MIGAVGFANVKMWTVSATGASGSFYAYYNSPGAYPENNNATLGMGGAQHFDATAETLSFAFPASYTPGATNHEIGFRLSSGWANYYSFGGGSTYNYQYGQYLNFAGHQQIAPITSDFVVGKVGGYTDVAAVPEPASWAMTIAGFGMVGGELRRRAKGSRPGAEAYACR